MPPPTANEQLILLLGDIHANEAALAAVLSDAYNRYAGRRLAIWFLGDLFGRGPRPGGAYRRLLNEEPEAAIIGNHEGGLIGAYQSAHFAGVTSGLYGADDWRVLLLHREELRSRAMLNCDNGRVVGGEVVETIRRWPLVCAPRPTIYMVHGGLEQPFEPPADGRLDSLRNHLVWDYVKQPTHAQYTLQAISWLAARRPDDPAIILPPDAAQPELVLVGHYHSRLLYDRDSGQWHNPVQLDTPYPLEGRTTLLSPGSVGFPRENRDLDASYCVLWIRNNRPFQAVFHKRAYDRQTVRNEMVQKGYPEATVKRLRLSGETETAQRGLAYSGRGCGPEDEDPAVHSIWRVS